MQISEPSTRPAPAWLELGLTSLECQAPARSELHARYVEIESEWIRENPERVAALSELAD